MMIHPLFTCSLPGLSPLQRRIGTSNPLHPLRRSPTGMRRRSYHTTLTIPSRSPSWPLSDDDSVHRTRRGEPTGSVSGKPGRSMNVGPGRPENASPDNIELHANERSRSNSRHGNATRLRRPCRWTTFCNGMAFPNCQETSRPDLFPRRNVTVSSL